MPRLLIALVAALLLAAPTLDAAARPSADVRATARANADKGLKLFKAGKHAEAYEHFAAAERLIHAPPHLLYMARARRELGQLLDAKRLYRSLVDEELTRRSPWQFRKAQEEGRQELKRLLQQIPSVEIIVEGAPLDDVSVFLDGEDATAAALGGRLDVDPGEHQIRVTAEGYEPAEQSISARAGAGTEAVELTLHRVHTPAVVPDSVDRDDPADHEGDGRADDGGSLAPGLVVGAVGVAGLGVGLVTGLLAMDKADELKQACPERAACPREYEPLLDDVHTLGTVSTVGFIAGGVLLATAVVLLIVQPDLDGDESASENDRAVLRPIVGPGWVGLTGRF